MPTMRERLPIHLWDESRPNEVEYRPNGWHFYWRFTVCGERVTSVRVTRSPARVTCTKCTETMNPTNETASRREEAPVPSLAVTEGGRPMASSTPNLDRNRSKGVRSKAISAPYAKEIGIAANNLSGITWTQRNEIEALLRAAFDYGYETGQKEAQVAFEAPGKLDAFVKEETP